MQTIDTIHARRSIRKYDPERPVPREVLEGIIEASLWAPSGTNRQAWQVVVATGETRDRLCQLISGTVTGLMARLESLPGRVVAATLKFFANLGGAPCLAIVFVPKTAARLDPEMAPQEAALAEAERLDRVESASALMQNLCLAAWDRGVGTCWMLAPRYAAKEIIEYLGLSDVELIAATPLGYPAHVPPGPARRPGRVMWLGFDD